MNQFQFTPLREGRRVGGCHPVQAVYFNSRPSARGDADGTERKRHAHGISIHAPPRGATAYKSIKELDGRVISIHAPPRGATRANVCICCRKYFNSRPSARGDRRRHARAQVLPISIHAPPRGATSTASPSIRTSNFNSRPSARGDARWLNAAFNLLIFQFTPLREGRHERNVAGAVHCDISIHAPPRGATAGRLPNQAGLAFQFTPLREGRRSPAASSPTTTAHFNSRPSARGDTTTARACSSPTYFNSRPSARGDLALTDVQRHVIEFQFTPLREGRLVH